MDSCHPVVSDNRGDEDTVIAGILSVLSDNHGDEDIRRAVVLLLMIIMVIKTHIKLSSCLSLAII